MSHTQETQLEQNLNQTFFKPQNVRANYLLKCIFGQIRNLEGTVVPRDSYVISFISILAPVPKRTYEFEVTKGHIEVVISCYLISAAVTNLVHSK